MGSVSSTNPGIAALDQILGITSATTSSPLSSQSVQSALQNATPGDIVHLSQQALQLQLASGLFGTPGTSSSITAPSAAAQQVSELLG